MANQCNGTLYIGVTANLIQRIWQHQQGLGSDFTVKHDLKLRVWYELHDNMFAALTRKKQLKNGSEAGSCV